MSLSTSRIQLCSLLTSLRFDGHAKVEAPAICYHPGPFQPSTLRLLPAASAEALGSVGVACDHDLHTRAEGDFESTYHGWRARIERITEFSSQQVHCSQRLGSMRSLWRPRASPERAGTDASTTIRSSNSPSNSSEKP